MDKQTDEEKNGTHIQRIEMTNWETLRKQEKKEKMKRENNN